MGTRTIVTFETNTPAEPGAPVTQEREDATIYLHWGSGVEGDLMSFFEHEEAAYADGKSNRFGDATYLAAQFVAWYVNQHPGGTGIGIYPTGHREDFLVRVHCCNGTKRPTVVVVD